MNTPFTVLIHSPHLPRAIRVTYKAINGCIKWIATYDSIEVKVGYATHQCIAETEARQWATNFKPSPKTLTEFCGLPDNALAKHISYSSPPDTDPCIVLMERIKEKAKEFVDTHIKNPEKEDYLMVENAMLIGANMGIKSLQNIAS